MCDVRSAVTAVLFCSFLFNGRRRSTGDSTCPVLDQCRCGATPNGLRVRCGPVAHVEDLPRDLAKLAGKTVRRLTQIHLNMTTLPAFYFANITTRALNVEHCSLDSLDENALAGLRTLKLFNLSKNRLTTIPGTLRAVESIAKLFLDKNYIQVFGDELTHLSSSLRSLSLDRNMITTFHEDALKEMTQLEKLWLSRNKIQDIPATLFKTTPVLKMLDLKDNFIRRVASPFNKLRSLEELYLDNNELDNIYRVTSAPLPSLKTLVLDGNPTTAITVFGPVNTNIETLSVRNGNVSIVNATAFTALPRLRSLDLSRNNIRYINGSVFHKETQLTIFRASDNSISSLEGTFSRTRQLQALYLSTNQIRDISKAFAGLGLLKELELKENEIQFIPDGPFETNSNLKRLDLSENGISWLGKNCFRGLVSLKYLFMASNRVMSLNGSLSYMPTLECLYFQDNRLRALDERDFMSGPRMRILYVSENQLADVRGAFKHLRTLESLLLQNNSLNTIHRASLPPELKALRLLAIEGNPLTCDCRLSWLIELPRGVTRGKPICESPPWLAGASLFNSTTDLMLNNWPEECDDRCVCTCQEDDNYGKYTYVNCSNANLTLPPDTFPKDAHVVDLSSNRLKSLSGSLADSVPRLQSLLLGHNLLTSLDAGRIPRGLQNLSIQNNRFAHFPMDIVSNFNLSSLWLSGNPWACDCEDYPFRQWAGRHERTIRDAGSLVCAEGTNPRVSLKPFMALQQNDLCPSTTTLLVSYGVTVLVLLTLGLCLAVVYLKRERQIKVWLYAHGLQCVKEDEVDKDKLFDVFLSFSSKDGDWAHANLVPGIEKAGFSVCTYDRNFIGGFLLKDIIQEAVARSRRTLLLLTQNFVESEWCRWEFRVAHHRALEDNINRLIVVVPGSVPEGADEDFALYMEVTNYLRWGEKHFWNKLMYSLPKKDGKRGTGMDPTSAPLLVTYRK